MREDHNRRARFETFHIAFEPFELLISELPQTAGLKVKHIDQSNEMDTVLIEAIPAGAFAFDVLQVSFTVKFSAIVEHIMLPGHVENVLGPAALENLIECVELLQLRQLGDISRVDKERRWSGHRVNAIERDLEGRGDILVRLFIEADVAVTDLQKTKIGGQQRSPGPRNF